jgi:PAT family beta-lactamase induction signal transducer AmpG
MLNFNAIKTIFTNPKFLKIFLFGIVSGMPFAILFTTIVGWLNDFNIDFTTVALIATARTPYSLKILWSPFIDYFTIPILGRFLGNRRSWMLLTSVGIASILYYMSFITPNADNFNQLWALSVLIGFLAATYDIAYDALRIEMLDKSEQAIGIAHTGLAYRIGVILTGAVALKCAHDYGWQNTFIFLSSLFVIGAFFSLLITTEIKPITAKENFFQSTYLSFKDLLSKDYIFLILFTIIIYKFGDAMLSFSGMKFYTVVGFSKEEIAYVVKICGLIAAIVGSYAGAIIMSKYGSFKGLIICGIAQMATNLGYIWLHHAGHSIPVFLITNICENFTAGMGGAALGGYISTLCNIKFAANHFALLSSCATLMNNTLTATSGKLIEWMGWDIYFVFTAVISTPSLAMLYFLNKKLGNQTVANEDNSRH